MTSRTLPAGAPEAFEVIETHRARREELLAKARAIAKKAEIERRDLYPDEARRFDDALMEADTLETEIERRQGDYDAARAPLPRRVLDAPTRGRGSGGPGGLLAPEQRMADWHAEHATAGQSGYEPAEIEAFSLGRLVRGMVTANWRDAEVERRALSEATDGAGGFLTPEVLSLAAIDRVRKAARVLEAGATTVPLESDSHSIPRLAGGVTGTWKQQNSPITEETPSFQRVTFVPKTLAVLVKLSLELFEDMTSAGSDLITNELLQALAITLDKEAITGNASMFGPTGVRNIAGVTIQSMGVNGATPTNWAPLVNAVTEIQGKNIEPNAAIYTSRTAKTFSTLADTTGQPLQRPPLIANLTQLVSNQISDSTTEGTSSDCSEIYTGRWADLMIGVRPALGVRLVRDDSMFRNTLSIGLVAWLRADVQLAHPESFVVTTGVRP